MTYLHFNTCQICGGNFVKHYAAAGPVCEADVTATFRVKMAFFSEYDQCGACGAWMQNPRVDDDMLNRYYAEGIYRATTGLSVEQTNQGEMRRALTDAALVKKWITTVRSHLDIGCGRGYFLEQVGAEIQHAIEPNHGYVINPAAIMFEDIENITGTYDLVSMIHSLEHSPYPMKDLQNLAARISPAGRAIIEVPSYESQGGPFRFAHLWHFEPRTMEYMLGKAGMVIEHQIMTPHLFVVAKRSNNGTVA